MLRVSNDRRPPGLDLRLTNGYSFAVGEVAEWLKATVC
jgi:hypothetical protein